MGKLRTKYSASIIPSFILTKGLRFSSPSAAAGFVGSSSINGNGYWYTNEVVALGIYLSGDTYVDSKSKLR